MVVLRFEPRPERRLQVFVFLSRFPFAGQSGIHLQGQGRYFFCSVFDWLDAGIGVLNGGIELGHTALKYLFKRHKSTFVDQPQFLGDEHVPWTPGVGLSYRYHIDQSGRPAEC